MINQVGFCIDVTDHPILERAKMKQILPASYMKCDLEFLEIQHPFFNSNKDQYYPC
jgi:hypothetical protein